MDKIKKELKNLLKELEEIAGIEEGYFEKFL
jgi:hypothetical protein